MKNLTSNKLTSYNKLKEKYGHDSKLDGFTDKAFIFGTYKPIPHTNITRWKDQYIAAYNAMHRSHLKNIRIHDFRHSHVSYLANAGADSWDIAERLGHSKEMVENRYSHMFPEKRLKMKKLLNDS